MSTEDHRGSTIGLLESLGRDLRHALRRLLRRPSFTLAAGVTLAVGIGAATAIFSVVYSVLIKPLPYPNADELIRGSFGFQAVARLRPGVTLTEAQADAERMLALWHDAWPLFSGLTVTREDLASLRLTPVVRPLKDDLVGGAASTLWVLMAAIGAVLLVACANIANLMLVRTDARRQELAVRAALDAVPARIARELLAESVSLGFVGGVLASRSPTWPSRF
ncbi:MAG TPA: hypothetical protein VIN61_00165 [Gammaproteobacteria bacterium]